MGLTFMPELATLVLAGLKRQTRRSIQPRDMLFTSRSGGTLHRLNKRGAFFARWYVGQTLAIQPGRGKKGVGHIRVTGIKRDPDVRKISFAEAALEGFFHPLDFLSVWVKLHDPKFFFEREGGVCYAGGRPISDDWLYVDTQGNPGVADDLTMHDHLKRRPAELYTAWVIDFEVVQP